MRWLLLTGLGLLACAPESPAANRSPLIQKNRVRPAPEPGGVIAARCANGTVDVEFAIQVTDPDLDDSSYVFWYIDYVSDRTKVQSRPFSQQRVAGGSVERTPSPATIPMSWLFDASPTSTHLVEVLVSDDDVTGPDGRYVDYLSGGSFDAYPWVIEIVDGSCR